MSVHRVGIVGANLYGRIYAQSFAKQPEVKLVGLAPARGDGETELAAQLGIKQYDSVPQMLDEAHLDVLCVCSATAEHADHTLLAAAAGVHVLCERPIAMSLEEAQRMIAAVSEAQVTFMVGHVLRFWPEYVAVNDLLASGELGQVRSATTSRVSGTLSPPWQQRLLDPGLGFGSLEALIHDMDYLGWVLGTPLSIHAQGIKAPSESWGQMQCLIEFANGGHAQSEASYLVPLSFPLSMYLRVLAEKGTVVFEFRGALSSRGASTRNLMVTRVGGTPEVLDVSASDAYESQISYFLRCIETGQQPELGTAKQATQALAMILAAARSAAQGETVSPVLG
jgi:UDP-N-acetylglucosamine 3-dehydrogenase